MTTSAALDALRDQVAAARAASRALAVATSAEKNAALAGIADGLRARADEVVAANARDVAKAEADGVAAAAIDRIRLDAGRVEGLAGSLAAVIALPDPVGETIDSAVRPNGLEIGRVRVPLGVIAAIYENRPNVTIDIAALCLKSGNACVLRGGREALESNRVLAAIIADGLRAAGLPGDAVQFIANTDRALVGALLEMHDLIDLMIPRGGKGLVERVRDEASMPVVAGGIGICHTYVDRSADLEMALEIVDNAKTRRVSICNALDVMILHTDIAGPFLTSLAGRWGERVELRADPASAALLAGAAARVAPAGPDDFDTEFLDMVAGVRVVDTAEAALAHIAAHGSGHSEAIVTTDYGLAERFLHEVDASTVYVNASTQFTDGGEFGLGAEVGISTGKLHARGPMGLRELTSYKWVVRGTGQTRPR
jgi:glutamate-5-semialdehyde dehydrogenase